MGSLAGSVVLVTGGSGVVGGGVAKRALALGARVVAPVRSAAAKAKLLVRGAAGAARGRAAACGRPLAARAAAGDA